MNKEDLLIKMKIEKEFLERNVNTAINTLRRILDNIERKMENNNIQSCDGLQGNEWRLYDDLSKLEEVNKMISYLETIE